MKRYTWENFPRAIQHTSKEFHPFPGLYPTRWAIFARWQVYQGRRAKNLYWRYLGKPNAAVAQFVHLYLNSRRTSKSLFAWEFDKEQTLARTETFGTRESAGITDYNERLWHLVDPFVGFPNTEIITQWRRGTMRPIEIIHGDRKFTIYGRGTEGMEAYATWLNAANIVVSGR